ncbi:hypothetical protein Fmac_007449 [Flemingia macrophylla]|uniref:Uncharacterized protein n=1 Tax=Flemingia macrophylla TaxID=520843 RepID=A0ABD1MUN5_9FABA
MMCHDLLPSPPPPPPQALQTQIQSIQCLLDSSLSAGFGSNPPSILLSLLGIFSSL